MKDVIKMCLGLLGLVMAVIALPISFYLQYQVLVRVQATELMMILFWIHVPLVISAALIAKILDMVREKV